MPVNLEFGSEAREKLLTGATKIARAVVSTMGPWGRNASIKRPPVPNPDGGLTYPPPIITKDGFTVAKNITSLEDDFEDMGAQILKEASIRTNRVAGDGTTTAIMLAQEMIQAGHALLNGGANAIQIRRGMEKARDIIIKNLKEMSREVKTIEEFKAIATISSQDEEIGSIVAEVISEVGEDGAVTLHRGAGSKLEYEMTSGMQVPVGYASQYFAKRGIANIQNPYILVTTEKIVDISKLQILPEIAEKVKGPVPFVIFSTGVEGDALATLAKGTHEKPDEFQFLVLQPPYYGDKQRDVLEDIAIATGANLIDKQLGKSIQSISIADLGTSASVMANHSNTTIIGLHGSPQDVQARVELIKERQKDIAEESKEEDYFKSRIAGLTGKIGKIYVGGSSQIEQQEKTHRVEDAVQATRAAHEEGILPGGGVALLRCIQDCIDLEQNLEGNERDGVFIVRDALDKQLYWISKNAGEDPAKVMNKVLSLKDWEGYNASTGEYGDMFDMKVIDPTKVPITALQNAVSVASAFLTCEVTISEYESSTH